MATPDGALQKYSNVKDELNNHINQNKSIFDAHEKIVMKLIDAENELRDAVAESGQGLNDGLNIVTVTPQTQTVYDEEKILSALRVSKEGAIAAGLIQINQRPPRITIGIVKQTPQA